MTTRNHLNLQHTANPTPLASVQPDQGTLRVEVMCTRSTDLQVIEYVTDEGHDANPLLHRALPGRLSLGELFLEPSEQASPKHVRIAVFGFQL